MSKVNRVSAVAAVALGGVGVVLAHRVYTDHGVIESQQRRISTLESKLNAAVAEANRAAATAGNPIPPAAPPVAPSADPVPAKPGAVPAKEQSMDERMRQMREQHLNALKDPAYRNAMLAQQKLMARRQLQDLPGWVQISGPALEQLVDMTAQHMMASTEIMRSVNHEDPQAAQTVQAKMEQLRQTQEQEVAQLLGAERAGRLKEYRDNVAAHMSIREINQKLGQADAIPDDKARQVAVAMSQADRAARSPLQQEIMAQGGVARDPAAQVAMQERFMKVHVQAQRQALEAARSYLSASQFKALEELTSRRLEDMESSLAIQRAMREATQQAPE